MMLRKELRIGIISVHAVAEQKKMQKKKSNPGLPYFR